MLKLISQPYPLYQDPRHHFRVALSISIFVTLFLLMFKPFGIGNYERTFLTLRIAGYGLVTFVTLILFFLISRRINPIRDEENWTTGKEILNQLLYVFVVGVANLVYTHFVFGMNFSVNAFLTFQLYTLFIGIFPISFFVFANHLKLSNQNSKDAALLTGEIEKHLEEGKKTLTRSNDQQDLLYLTSENEKEQLQIPVDELVLIESADNYSTVYFIKNGKIEHRLLRSSLKRLEKLVPHQDLLRCHRTYLVNLQKVIAVKGNAQGYRLCFEGFDQTFPVSRSLNDTIRERLRHLAHR